MLEAPSAADASSRAVLGLVGVGAAWVLQASWATVRSPFDALLAVVVVVGAVHGLLGWAPRLRLPARLEPTSYAAYGIVLLLFLLFTPDRLGADPAPVLGIRLACGLLIGVVVHGVFDQTSLRRAVLPHWRGVAVLGLLPGALGVVVLASFGLPAAEPSRADTVLAAGGQVDGDAPGSPQAAPANGPAGAPAAPGPATAQAAATTVAPTAGARAATTASTAAPLPTAPPTTPAPRRAVKVLIAGDSTASATGGGMRTWGQKNGRAQVEGRGTDGCALQQDGTAYWRDGWAQNKNGDCLGLVGATIATATRTKPDLILLFIGSNQLSDWVLPGQSTPTYIGQPAFDQLYSNAVTAALGRLGSLGIPILFTTLPVPDVHGMEAGPGSGPFKMNDAGRTRRLNELTASAVRGLPLAAMARYAERISGPDGTVPDSLRRDGLHVNQAAVPGIMDRGLEADLRAAYQEVVGRVPSSARGAAHHWSRG